MYKLRVFWEDHIQMRVVRLLIWMITKLCKYKNNQLADTLRACAEGYYTRPDEEWLKGYRA